VRYGANRAELEAMLCSIHMESARQARMRYPNPDLGEQLRLDHARYTEHVALAAGGMSSSSGRSARPRTLVRELREACRRRTMPPRKTACSSRQTPQA